MGGSAGMKGLPGLIVMCVLGVALCVDARADPTELTWLSDVTMRAPVPFPRDGLASPQQVIDALGPIKQVQVACPNDRSSYQSQMQRGARIYFQAPQTNLADHALLNRLIIAGYTAAYRLCPMGDGLNFNDMGFVEFYAPDADGSPALILAAREAHWLEGWKEISTPEEDQERAAQAAAQAQARAEAQAQQQQAASAQAQATPVQYAPTQADTGMSIVDFMLLPFKLLFDLIFIIVFACLAVWLFRRREDVIAFFYSLTPHPATDMVQQRLNGDQPLDGQLLAEIMRQTPGSPIEQRVRAEQAQRLASMVRAAAEARLQELERLKAAAVQEAAYMRAQEDLRGAVEGHELAIARLDALKAWNTQNGRRPSP